MSDGIPRPVLTDRFAQAFAFALVVHATQRRKGTTIPYVAHLMGVAAHVLDYGADEDTAIAALLHDAAEDHGGKAMLAQIEARFGARVAAIVAACSDTFEARKPPWRERKIAYVAHVATADPATCLVAAADKLHNARAILQDLRNAGPEVFGRFSASEEQTGWYYEAVADALHRRLATTEGVALVNELRHAVGEIAAHKGGERFRAGVALAKAGKPCPNA